MYRLRLMAQVRYGHIKAYFELGSTSNSGVLRTREQVERTQP